MAALKIPWREWLPFKNWRIVGVVDAADEIPKHLPPNGVILVGSRQYPKWIAFDCPCRVGHRILLNTDIARLPYWVVTIKGALTISPSIDFFEGKRRCHYFVKKGRVVWASERVRK
jgi:Family of unknown function (DUF6527)